MTAVLEALWPLVSLIVDRIPSVLALFTRLSVLLLFLPGISGGSVPVRVRLTFAIALMGLLLPLTPPADVGYAAGDLAAVFGGEAFVGLTLGFAVRVFVFSLNVAGAIIAQAMSLSQIFGVTAEGDNSSLLSTTLTMAGAALFLTSGLDTEVIALFLQNLETVPLGFAATMPVGEAAESATRLAGEALRFGVTLALPFMVLNFAYYLILGFLNRAMPQLMITFVGLPAITLSGLILFVVGSGVLLTVWLSKISGLLSP